MKIKIHSCLKLTAIFLGVVCATKIFAQNELGPISPIQIAKDGQLSYHVDTNGDRVPDFSYCGFMASEKAIPDVAVKLIVPAINGDATQQIQRAIDYISSLPLDREGFRGTVLLGKGVFTVAGSLIIRNSGVVLRGSGCGEKGTVLVGTGFDRETLIRITGVNDRKSEKALDLTNIFFPVNSTILTFKNKHSFKLGDQVVVTRPSTKDWLKKIGADKIGIYVDYTLTKWDAGDFDQHWYRRVIAVTPESITIDVPLTNSLDPQYGGGNVASYSWAGQINKVGVENLQCISSYDSSNSKDENHRWMAITMDNVTDSWVRRVVAKNFVSSAVSIWETAQRITVEDCKSLAPIGETGNYRRYSFHTIGQQILFQRCYAEYGYHAFSVGFTASGPNAFVQCYSFMPFNFSGAIGGWSTGILFDKLTVDGGVISLAYRDVDGQGGGWSTANSLCWQCRAAQIHLPAPPTAQNWAYGSWAQGYGNGHHELEHAFLKPESFYYAQLEQRMGKKSLEENKLLVYDSKPTSAPSIELAAQYTQRSKFPDLIMDKWIDEMIEKYPIASEVSDSKLISEIVFPMAPKVVDNAPILSIKNGWIVMGNQVAAGKRNRTSMWKGTTRPSELKNPAPNLVRFVPGRIGRGLTDDLDTLVNDMIGNHVLMMQNFPALWYERRRDDHARTRRANADVWTPFYEQPFSRSGKGEAFDRLSKYDITKWNTWYWLRLKRFADLSDQKGLLFLEEHYLQHNIIEEGAHWADYPWRTANNINQTGFAEYPALAGDKRVYMGEEFYDTTNLVRKKYHEEYIRKSLENFKDNTNIIHHLGMEYTGPLHFVKFWLDVINQWEKENHKKVLVMLPGTKDVQDSILADPKMAAIVNAIDVVQWQYRKDSSLYSPPGGVSLTERQFARILEVGETSFEQVYRVVREFRAAYPDKAILYTRRGVKFSEWASFIGGGSLAAIPVIADKKFFEDAVGMENMPNEKMSPKQYVLGKKGVGYIVFCENSKLTLDLSKDKSNYTLQWINPSTGEIIPSKKHVSGAVIQNFEAPLKGPVVAWVSRNTKK